MPYYFDFYLTKSNCLGKVNMYVMVNLAFWGDFFGPSYTNQFYRYQQYKNKNLQQIIGKEEKIACSQTNFEALFKDTILYHGTHLENVKSILEHGLVCVKVIFLKKRN